MLSDRESLFYAPDLLRKSGTGIATRTAMAVLVRIRAGAIKMKRTTLVITTALAVLLISVPQALGQGRTTTGHASNNHASKKRAEKQTFVPRVEGSSASFIVEGLITDARPGAIRIKTAKGERITFEIDDQTTVLDTGELVSISTMAEIELTPSDLHVFDRVEVVAERDGLRPLARIVTRIHSERDQVAKR
jgi:hypothetical protein